MTKFQDMELPSQIKTALQKMQFDTPMPIQAQTIPAILEGKDLIGCAQTGTGKTAAFCIPMIASLLANEKTTALVLVPTRELAQQILGVVSQLTSDCREIRTALLIGGADMMRQFRSLQANPRIIVATPGRIFDHLRRKNSILKDMGILVLDEADRMLDMGFAPQLNQILKFVPKQRQTLLFSATLAPEINQLAQKYLQNPVRVNVGAISQPKSAIKQSVLQVSHREKNEVVLNELNAREGSVIIFARTQRRTDKLADYIEDYGHKVTRIHGGLRQNQRNTAMQGFRTGKFRVLVATDIAARGLDIPHISHVINYDMPQAPEDYVHRIGRTARAGAEGEALCLLVPEDKEMWRRIAKVCKIDSKMSSGPRAAMEKKSGAEASSESAPSETRRPERKERPFRDRSEGRPQRRRDDRAPRAPRGDRPFRDNRNEDRAARAPREDRPFRDNRHENRNSRTAHAERPFREFRNEDRAPRPARIDRPFRENRGENRGARPDQDARPFTRKKPWQRKADAKFKQHKPFLSLEDFSLEEEKNAEARREGRPIRTRAFSEARKGGKSFGKKKPFYRRENRDTPRF